MTPNGFIVAVFIAAYLIGSLPFGYLLTQVIKKTDIRNYGSGNIGATNVLRVMGWKAALPVFVLDMLKGVTAVLLAKAVTDLPAVYLTAGFLALVGHSFPVFLRFKGGKAAATGIGVVVMISGWAALSLIVIAILVIIITRYVSLGSITGALAVPLFFLLLGFELSYIIFGLATAALIGYRHHENISRLLKGTESRIGQKS